MTGTPRRALLPLLATFVLLLAGCIPNLPGSRAPLSERRFNFAAAGPDAPAAPAGYSIILFREPFRRAAEALAALHRQHEGVEAELISVDEISQGPEVALSIPWAGWQGRGAGDPTILGYNFALSQKIIARLTQRGAEAAPVGVVILGDAGIIPPSYYFWLPRLPLGQQAVEPEQLDFWVASDLLYASPDLSLSPAWAVGRLPVSTPQDALAVAAKFQRWYAEGGPRQPGPLLFFGGHPRGGATPAGEILYLGLQEAGALGARAQPHFQTEGAANAEVLHEALARRPAAVTVVAGTGLGDGIGLDDADSVGSTRLLGLPAKAGLGLVVSPGCADCAFDHDLNRKLFDRDQIAAGEALLLAEGGALGLVAGVRPPLYLERFGFRNGRPQLAGFGPSGDAVIAFVAAAARSGPGTRRIGSAYLEALAALPPAPPASGGARLAPPLVEVALLADPVMRLPGLAEGARPVPPRPRLPAGAGAEVPVIPAGIDLTISLPADGPSARLSLIRPQDTATLVELAELPAGGTLRLGQVAPGLHLMRATGPDGAVDWRWFRIAAAGEAPAETSVQTTAPVTSASPPPSGIAAPSPPLPAAPAAGRGDGGGARPSPAGPLAHLASYRDESGLAEGWRVLRGRLGPLLEGRTPLPITIEVPDQGRFLRLAVGPFADGPAAEAFCAAVAEAGSWCRVLR